MRQHRTTFEKNDNMCFGIEVFVELKSIIFMTWKLQQSMFGASSVIWTSNDLFSIWRFRYFNNSIYCIDITNMKRYLTVLFLWKPWVWDIKKHSGLWFIFTKSTWLMRSGTWVHFVLDEIFSEKCDVFWVEKWWCFW